MSSSILARMTLANEPVVFLLDSLNTLENTIQAWSINDEAPRTVDLSAYRNTKPASDAQEAQMVEAYRARYSPPGGIILRRRLFKENPATTGKHIIPKEQDTKHNVLESPENKAAQKRESYPQEASKHPVQQTQQHNPLGDIEKVLLVERITHAFATSFADAMSKAVREALK